MRTAKQGAAIAHPFPLWAARRVARPVGVALFAAGVALLVSNHGWIEATYHRDSYKPTHVAMSDIKRLPDDTWLATFTPTPAGASAPAIGLPRTISQQAHIDHILGGREDAKIPWIGTHTGTILLNEKAISMPVMPLDWDPQTIRRLGMRAALPGVTLAGIGLLLLMAGGAKPRRQRDA